MIDILLVEDNAGDVRLFREMFDDNYLNNTLHVVKDGEEAMRFLHREGPFADAVRPHLVLLDLNLPRKNGYAVLEEIKNDQNLRCIPVIVLTSSNAEKDINRAYDLHANSYIIKPIDLERLVKMIELIKTFWFTTVELPFR